MCNPCKFINLMALIVSVSFSDVLLTNLEYGDEIDKYGRWYYYDDSFNHGTSKIRSHVAYYGDYNLMKPSQAFHPGAASDSCVIMNYQLGASSPMYFSYVNIGFGLIDTSNLTGSDTIKFHIRSNRTRYIEFKTRTSSVTNYQFHQINIEATSQWQWVEIPLNSDFLKQPNWGNANQIVPFNIQKIYSIEWQIRNGVTGNHDGDTGQIYIDDLTLTGKPVQFQPPAQPVLISPLNNAYSIPVNPTIFTWTKPFAVQHFTFELSAPNDSLSFIHSDDSTENTSKNIENLQPGSTYHWKVKASNLYGESDWTRGKFTTVSIPASPSLLAPAKNITLSTLNPTFSWTPVNEASTYKFDLSTDDAFSTIVSTQTLTTNAYTTERLDTNTIYYWRTQASNSAGHGQFSETWSFATPVIPVKPELSSPENNATAVPVPVELTWNATAGAITYDVEIIANNGQITNYTGITLTTLRITDLTSDSKYYWRVRGVSTMAGSWSEQFNFTTLTIPPAAPILLSPANNKTVSSFTPTLYWQAQYSAAIYHVYISIDSSFTVTYKDSTPGNFYKTPVLENNARYYWQVTAGNSAGRSAVSARWEFKTAILPTAPIQISNGIDTVLELPFKCMWYSNSADVETYNFQLFTDLYMTDTLINNYNLTDTFMVLTSLESKKVYWWRVRAINKTGPGAFSPAAKLTIEFTSVALAPKNLYIKVTDAAVQKNVVSLTLPKMSPFSFSIYDIRGKLVQSYTSANHPAGFHEIALKSSTPGKYILYFNAGTYNRVISFISR